MCMGGDVVRCVVGEGGERTMREIEKYTTTTPSLV